MIMIEPEYPLGQLLTMKTEEAQFDLAMSRDDVEKDTVPLPKVWQVVAYDVSANGIRYRCVSEDCDAVVYALEVKPVGEVAPFEDNRGSACV